MLILHVGLPKTGTTFLQHRIFAHTPGLTFIHRRQGPEAAAATWEFRVYAFTHRVAAVWYRHRLRARLNAFASGGRPVLLTEENISISPTRFWQGGGPTPPSLARRLTALAAVLDPALAPVKVIVGIRRQDSWLAARYAGSSRHFPDFSQADFDRRMAKIAAAPALDGPLGWLDYTRMRDTLAAAIGPENVHLLPLERIAAAPAEAIEDVGRFLGLELLEKGREYSSKPRNQRSVGENVWRMRRDETLLTLEPGLQHALRARFAEPNRALDAEMSLGYAP